MKLEIKKEFVLVALGLMIFEPVLRGAGQLIFNMGLFGLNTFGDYLIKSAALMTPPDPVFYLLAFGLGLLIARTVRDASNLPPVKERIPSALSAKIAALLKSPKANAALLFVCFLFLSVGFYSAIAQTRLITSFRQHVASIAPFISEDEEELLISRWTQMQYQDDYKKLFNDMKSIADKNGVVLPPNRVFDLASF